MFPQVTALFDDAEDVRNPLQQRLDGAAKPERHRRVQVTAAPTSARVPARVGSRSGGVIRRSCVRRHDALRARIRSGLACPSQPGRRMGGARRGSPDRRGAATGVATWPLVGRDGELGVLRRSLDEGARGMVITGEIGVGKSRLAAAFRDGLVADGWTSSHHVASEARRAIPFSAFTALLDDAGDARNPLQRLLDGAARLDSGSAPVLLHVEDGQWLDDESLAFIQQVVESTTATLLLTVRSGDPSSGRVLALARALGLARLEVQPLSRREVADLLTTLVPGISRAEAHRLWELTAGNPLYLHELVTRSLEQGGTMQTDEGRVLAAVDHAGLADVVGGRLDDLDAGQQEVVELLAVAPGAPLDLLYRCAGTGGVVDLQRRRLVVVVESGRRLVATLAHPIYAEVVAGRMGVATRRIRRRQVLADVEARGSRRGSDLVQSAMWATEEGDAVDPESLLAVARRLSGSFNDVVGGSPDASSPSPVRGGLQTSAARLAKAAVAAGGGFAAAETWFKAESLRDSGFRAVAEALAAMYETAGSAEERTRVAVTAAGLDLLLGRSAPGEALDGLEELQRSAASTELARTVDAWRVIHLTMNGSHARAVELGREVLADESTHPRDRLLLAGSLVGCLLLIGQTDEALVTADRLLGAVGVEDDQWDVGSLLLGRLLALSCVGRGEEADELVTQLMAISEATGNDAGVAVFGVARAQDAAFRGRPLDVLEAASRAVGAQREAEDSALIGTHGPAHAAVAHGHALLGHRSRTSSSRCSRSWSRRGWPSCRGASARPWPPSAPGSTRAWVACPAARSSCTTWCAWESVGAAPTCGRSWTPVPTATCGRRSPPTARPSTPTTAPASTPSRSSWSASATCWRRPRPPRRRRPVTGRPATVPPRWRPGSAAVPSPSAVRAPRRRRSR